MKRVAVLGCTGSVGESTLRVVEAAPDRFEIVALAAGRNYQRLCAQISKHNPRLVSVCSDDEAEPLCAMLGSIEGEVVTGEEGLCRVATLSYVDVVVMAVSGAAALAPTLAALCAGKRVALANKECLVMAGELVMETARKNKATILPVDSEHSGVFQALAGRPIGQVRRIILPASGGPFLDTGPEELERVTAEDALKHPTWSMGKKISIDSATLMNKAFEVIEARWLFGIEPSRIEVVIHPRSVVHAMVEMADGSIIAQLSVPDMRHPILHALTWPERADIGLPIIDFEKIGSLEFRPLDSDRFPAIGLAFRSLEMGGSAPAVLAAADEVAVEAFLDGRIPFTRIVPLISEVLENHDPSPVDSVETAIQADARAREEAQKRIG